MALSSLWVQQVQVNRPLWHLIIGYRNQNSKGHIITIEDPIEFVHEHAGCIITQREVGIDTRLI